MQGEDSNNDFWQAIEDWRAQADFGWAELTPEEVDGWRDRSPGREFSWLDRDISRTQKLHLNK